MKDILNTVIKPNELSEFEPFIDELAQLTGKLNHLQKHPFVSVPQIKYLLQYGVTFDISDVNYWKFLDTSIVNSLEHMTFSDIVSVFRLLIEENKLSDEVVIKAIGLVKDLFPSGTPKDLVEFSLIYNNKDI